MEDVMLQISVPIALISLSVAILLTIAMIIIMISRGYSGADKDAWPRLALYMSFLLICVFLLCYGSMLGAYVLFQGFLNHSYPPWTVVTLLLSTIVLTLPGLFLIISTQIYVESVLNRRSPPKKSANKIEKFWHPYSFEFPELDQLDAHRYNDKVSWMQLAQFGIFFCPLLFLWFSRAWENQSVLLGLLNLVVFFFIDDWSVISNYTTILKGRIPKSQRYRLFIANSLLIPTTLIAFYSYTDIFLFITFSVVFSVFIFWRLYYDFHYREEYA